jgi:hypothetical protein
LVTIEKEKDIVLLVENAIHKLKGVKEYTEKENKQIVSNLAKDLEGIMPMGTICMEIISRLHDHLSPRTIRKYLDVKYKVKSRVDNARKQKKNNQSSLAALGPLNNVSGMVVVNDRNEISFPDVNNKQSLQSSEISVIENSKAIRSLYQQESLNSTEQEQPSIGQDNTEITECRGCVQRDEKIKELEESHQKVQQFTPADKMGPFVATESHKEKIEEPIEFEVSKMGWEIRDFFISNNIRSTKDTIWFSGRIDRTTGKIINFDLGRIG